MGVHGGPGGTRDCRESAVAEWEEECHPARRRWCGRVGGWYTCVVWRKRWFSCEVSWLFLLPTEGLCLGRGVVIWLHADSKSAMPQPHLTVRTYRGLSGFFWRVSEVFQPRFALATRNIVHIVLGISLSASMHNAYLTALGALGQMWEVNGDLDDHRMASHGLQSTERYLTSSGKPGWSVSKLRSSCNFYC